MKHSFIQTFKAIIICIIVLVGVSTASAQWISFNANANVSDPITSSSHDEVKLGGLTVGTFLVNFESFFQSSVHITDSLFIVGLKKQLAGIPWYNTNWAYRTKLTINHAKVSGTDQTDFPVLVHTTLGHVALASGNDIVAVDDDGVTKLPYELESYNAATGDVVMWARVPTLSHTTDTNIYLYYGNASAKNQSNKTGVWDANTKGVWHLADGTNLSATDSTGDDNGTITAATATSGKIDGAANFSSAGIALGDIASLHNATALTISAWVNPSSGAGGVVFGKDVGTAVVDPYQEYLLAVNGGHIAFYLSTGTAGSRKILTSTSATSTVPASAWAYLTATWDGTTMSVYKNGVKDATTVLFNGPIDANTSAAYIGRQTFTAPANIGYFLGALDEIHVADTARSAGWITTEYNNQNSPSTFYTPQAEESYSSLVQGGGGQTKTPLCVDRSTGQLLLCQ